MDVLKPLIGSKLLTSSAAREILSSVLLSSVGRPLDLLYSRLGGINGRFFPTGWGNLGVVNLQQDIDLIKNWPPQGIKITWKLLQQGNQEGSPYKLFEGSFRTPCINRIYDALPPESRSGRVQLLVPACGLSATNAAAAAGVEPLFDQQHTSAAVIHLAATGDHGFSRRLKLGAPLLKQGVCQLVHESPYYGARRPPEQKGSKLCAVSDLLALGWATIYESLCLLHWLEEEGVQQRGICGLSMGGVHASMTAGLYPKPLAITPLLTPRSAAVAYCDGALAPLMSWHALLADKDWADNEVEQVIAAASQKVSLLNEARYVQLKQLKHQLEMAEESLGLWQQQQQHNSQQQQSTQQQSTQQQGNQNQRQHQSSFHEQQQQRQQHWEKHTTESQQQADEAVAAVQTAAALAAAAEAAVAEALVEQDHQQQQKTATAGDNSRSNSSNLHINVSAGAVSTSTSEASSWRREVRRRQAAAEVAGVAVLAELASPAPPPPDTFRRLRHVLETYTDVTRYPCPVRPDAAVLVAARDDGYVDMASVKALQAHWPGSELRLVSGGHVSAFLMHQDAFRAALKDSLVKLAAGPATTAVQTDAGSNSSSAGAAA